MLDIGELVGKLRVDDKEMTKGLKKGEASFKDFAGKVSKMAFAAGTAAAVALVGGLLGALDQQAVGAKISAQLGGTTEDAKTYGKLAGKLYAEGWGDDIKSIGETIKAVASAKILPDGTPAELEDIARKAQILADVFGQDVNESVRAVQQLIRNGLVPDATSGFDLIASGIQGGLDKSGDLLDTINEYSTEFRELGLTGAQAFGLLQQAVKGGARDTDTAADALKEFAIRSKDASTTSIDGFKSLGLNAKQMTAQFAAGGKGAADGLQLVLTKLGAMKNPVEQNRIAVELFGTKAEDLGNALYSMNLDTATTAFSGAAGAIQRAGDAVSATDASKLETFKREATQAATAFAAGLVPSLEQAAHWMQQNMDIVRPFAIGLSALAAAIILVNAGMKAWAAIQVIWSGVTKVAAGIQWLFNTALFASPITWIVVGILALIAVIVLIATKTDWFQRLWAWAWGGIKTAALAVWGWIMGTLWPGLKAVFVDIGNKAMWLWNNAIAPAWAGIQAVIAFVANIVISYINLMAWGFKVTIGAAVMWLWTSVVQPTFSAFGAIAVWLWTSVLSPVFSQIWAGIQQVGKTAMWLWTNALLPAFQGIGAAAMWLWNSAIMPAVRGIGSAFSWLWGNVISPTWNFIMAGVALVGSAVKGTFDKISGWISNAFSSAVGIVRGAMNGVIGVINGAIGGINSVIDKANSVPGVNFPHLPSLPHLAQGGAVLPRAGGTPVVMGDGGQVEYGIPDSAFQRYVTQAVAAGGGHAELKVSVELVRDGVMKIVRTEVTRKGLTTLQQTP